MSVYEIMLKAELERINSDSRIINLQLPTIAEPIATLSILRDGEEISIEPDNLRPGDCVFDREWPPKRVYENVSIDVIKAAPPRPPIGKLWPGSLAQLKAYQDLGYGQDFPKVVKGSDGFLRLQQPAYENPNPNPPGDRDDRSHRLPEEETEPVDHLDRLRRRRQF